MAPTPGFPARAQWVLPAVPSSSGDAASGAAASPADGSASVAAAAAARTTIPAVAVPPIVSAHVDPAGAPSAERDIQARRLAQSFRVAYPTPDAIPLTPAVLPTAYLHYSPTHVPVQMAGVPPVAAWPHAQPWTLNWGPLRGEAQAPAAAAAAVVAGAAATTASSQSAAAASASEERDRSSSVQRDSRSASVQRAGGPLPTQQQHKCVMCPAYTHAFHMSHRQL